MKRIAFVIMLVFGTLLAGCQKEDKTTTLTGYDESRLSLTAFADNASIEGGFTFTAAADWYTQVSYDTPVKSGTNEWITLEPANGSAGTITINIELQPNTTGTNRTATIKIICGDTVLTITVTQRADDAPSTGDPTIPGTFDPAITITSIESTSEWNGNAKFYFEYDSVLMSNGLPRLKKMWTDDAEAEDANGNVTRAHAEYIFTYENNTMIATSYMDGTLIDRQIATIGNNGYIEQLVRESEGAVSSKPYRRYAPAANDITFITSYTYTYNNEGYLEKTVETSDFSSSVYNFDFSWNNGNLSQLNWDNGNDYLSYTQLPVAKTSLDMTGVILGLISTSEGLNFAYGNSVFTIIGMMGKSNTNLIDKIESTGTSYHNVRFDYETDSRGRIVKITATEINSGTNTPGYDGTRSDVDEPDVCIFTYAQ